MEHVLGVIDGLCEEMGPKSDTCNGAPFREGKEGHDEKQKFVVGGNENAVELAGEGTDEDGGHMAAAKTLTIEQLRTRFLHRSSRLRISMCRLGSGETEMN